MGGVDRSVTIRLRVTQAEFDAAMARAGISVEALAAEVKAAGAAAGGGGKGMDDFAVKTKKAADSGIGLKSTLVTLAPALIPIAAAAAVVGGGLVGMGASGVLAFKGIQKEMKANTAEGKVFSAGVKSVQGDLGKLEAVAASNVLAGFQAGVHTINADMPSLIKSTSVFSKDLGDIGKHTISGVLGEYKALTPELQKGAGLVDHLAIKFDSWANGPGGAKFAHALGDGFQRALPFLEDSATAVGHLFEAANNSGALEVLDGAVRLFNLIPVDVLKVAVPLATGLVFAVKSMKVAEQAGVWIGGLTGKLGGLAAAETGATVASAGMASALGPLAGILVGGYAVTQQFGDQLDHVSNKFATGKIMADQNVTGVQDLTSAYQDFIGVAPTSTGALLQFALSSKNVGIGVGGLSDQMRDLLPHLSALGVSTADVQAGVSGNDDAYQKLTDRIKAHGGATEADITALNGLHTAFANTADSADTTADAVTGLTDKQRKLADQTLSTAGQLGFLGDALATLSGNLVDAAQQELRLKDSLGTAADNYKAAREQTHQYGTSLDENTVKGRANKEWLLSQITAINSHTEAVGKQTGSVEKATGALASDEKQLRAAASAAGLNKDQVDALIRKYAATPAEVRTKVLADTKQALANIDIVKANIQALRDHQITITTYLQNVILPGLKTDSSTRDSHHAGGGTVGGRGGSKADDQLTWLSTGEEVIQEPQASKFRPLLKAINAGHFAGGGTVGDISHTPSGWIYAGIIYSTQRSALNARTRAEQKAEQTAATPHDVTRTAFGGVVDGIIAGVRGQVPNAAAAMHDLSKAMTDAFKLKGIGVEVDVARAKLTQLKQDQSQLAGDTTSALRQNFNPAQAGSDYASVVSGFGGQTASANDFTHKFDLLSARGLNKSYLAELGRNGGGDTFDALYAQASKGGSLGDVNRAYTAYQSATAGAGKVAGADVYGKAVAAQQKQVDQLIGAYRSQKATIDRLVNSVVRLTGRPVVVEIDGKAVTSANAKHLAKVSI